MAEDKHYPDAEKVAEPGYDAQVAPAHKSDVNSLYEEDTNLKRGLKPRHVSLLSIGGIIGTGLFLGTGNALVNAGPLGLWLGYSIYGFILIGIMQGLGEMAAYMPLPGGHMMYAGRFVDKALGFAVTWGYALQWCLVCPAELSAVAVLFNYWVSPERLNNGVWIAIALVCILIINLFPASVYGESEFIFSTIKILTIMGLIICGICINCGAGPKGEYIGFRYWKNPGPFGVNYLGISGAKGNFLGFWAVFTQAAFSYFGSEVVAVAAAESKNPTRAIPRSLKQVYIRICLFYILGTFIIGLNIPSTHPQLGTASDASASPFVIAIQEAGVTALPHIINACLVSSAWSAANADIYIAGRSFYTLAKHGWLPKVFLKTNKRGAPWPASILGACSGLLAFMTVNNNANKVFNWFVNLISVLGLMLYMCICWSYLRFRKGLEAQGISRDELPFRSPFARAGAYVGLGIIPFIVFFSAWSVFRDTKHFKTDVFITNYLPAVLVPILYIGYKIYGRTCLLPYDKMDVTTGGRLKKDIQDEEPEPARTILGRIRDCIF